MKVNNVSIEEIDFGLCPVFLTSNVQIDPWGVGGGKKSGFGKRSFIRQTRIFSLSFELCV